MIGDLLRKWKPSSLSVPRSARGKQHAHLMGKAFSSLVLFPFVDQCGLPKDGDVLRLMGKSIICLCSFSPLRERATA